ncbi:LacI family DNA-binding transcriptional regulator [Dactylosporangium sp. CA-233914]|uniref:LacI family DNA-binding transcriptional regulator n=1 Tax=Dactylosporangium sp. CA-233914 TaxID=3239934 RepID=UPI003D906FA3
MTANPAPRPEVTSFDVARVAGVSRATVSHILNGRGRRFSSETQERVRRAAEELQYRPSPAGRALVRGRSDLVVAVVPNTTFGTNLQDTIDWLAAEFAPAGLQVVVRLAGPDPSATLGALQALRPAAVLDLGTLPQSDRDVLLKSGVVMLDSAPDLNVEVGRLLTEGALRRGPRPLVYAALLDTRSDVFGPGRFAGMAAEADSRGLSAPTQVNVPLDLAGATAALRPLLHTGVPVAVGCYNDEVAIAVLAAARELELDVPTDLTIVGVDHTPIGQLVSPRLTTIHVETAHMVSKAARTIQKALGLSTARTTTPPTIADGPVLRLVPGDTT